MEGRKLQLKDCENRETLRKYGELIKANIYLISSGDNEVTVTDFYDENLSAITIPLDPALNPAQNATKYFKDYKKSCTAVATLGSLIEKDVAEIDYLESVLDSISRASSSAEIAEITSELTAEGYIRANSKAKPKKPALKFEEYESKEGYKIAVGKNNLQNDLLTTRLASKLDLWFHTKDIHGSHVIVFCNGGKVSDETLLFAATLAAKNSKARYSSKVPVDYTYIKYVKKPSKAKAGMVIYTDNKTLFVNPTKEAAL
jgi:predicted ribosome quality control (RQC) complex YloA/Tae2 family protein